MRKKALSICLLVLIVLFTLPVVIEAQNEVILKSKLKKSLNSFGVGAGIIIQEQEYSPIMEFKFLHPELNVLAAFRLEKEEKEWWERDENEYKPSTLAYAGIERRILKREGLELKAGILYLGGNGFSPDLSLEISNYQYFVELKGIGLEAPTLAGVVGIKF